MGLWGGFDIFVRVFLFFFFFFCGSPWTVESPLLGLQNNGLSVPPNNLSGNILERIVQWLLEQSVVCVSGRPASPLDASESHFKISVVRICLFQVRILRRKEKKMLLHEIVRAELKPFMAFVLRTNVITHFEICLIDFCWLAKVKPRWHVRCNICVIIQGVPP